MGFRAERVKHTDCPKCGESVDTADARPLTRMPCPHCGRKFRVPARVGTMLVTALLGEGTGSLVYEATDRVLNRPVALKVMKKLPETVPGAQNGIDEAHALLLLDHPHVVKVYAVDTRRGQPCIIMEVLRGGSMKDLMTRGKTIPEAKALAIALDIASGLKAAASRGLLHLDVKPGNIMFDDKGRAKLLDFGFAGVDTEDRPNEILGTPFYVSPELLRRQTPDHRADIYSFGATLFHALTGRPPFQDKSIKKLVLARLDNPAPDVGKLKPELHERTVKLVNRMLATEPEERHRTYDDLILDIELAIDPSREPPAPVETPKPAPRPRKRAIRTFPDAQQAARDWMRYMGYLDASVTAASYDSGFDIQSSTGIAQVKAQRKPAESRDIERFAEVAEGQNCQGFYFSMGGYTDNARRLADQKNIALFILTKAASAEPENHLARTLLQESPQLQSPW